MKMPSEDIYDILKAKGVLDGFELFMGKEPSGIAGETEKDCVSMYDVGSGSQNPKFAIDSWMIHFRSRTKEYQTGFHNLSVIRTALEGSPAIVQNNTRYIGFWVESPPSFIERDENDRPIFTMHMRIEREPLEAMDGHRKSIAYKGAA